MSIGAYVIAAATSCCEMFRRSPPAIQQVTSEEPPYDTKGSAMPLVGTRASTTLTLMAACTTSIAVAPAARNAEAGSGARRAARNPRHATIPNPRTTPNAPRKPSSSPTMAKMKSVWG